MEIHSLKLLVTETDLNHLATLMLPLNQQVRDLRVHLAPDGVHITGVYHLLIPVTFETVWQLSILGGKVGAHLANLKVSGFGGALLKPALLGIIEDATREEDALQMQGDTLLLDPDRLLSKQGIPARMNLTSVQCCQGQIVLEAST